MWQRQWMLVCGGRELITNALRVVMLYEDSIFIVEVNPSFAFENEVFNFCKINQGFLSSVCYYLILHLNDGCKEECNKESLVLKSELLDKEVFVLSCVDFN